MSDLATVFLILIYHEITGRSVRNTIVTIVSAFVGIFIGGVIWEVIRAFLP